MWSKHESLNACLTREGVCWDNGCECFGPSIIRDLGCPDVLNGEDVEVEEGHDEHAQVPDCRLHPGRIIKESESE